MKGVLKLMSVFAVVCILGGCINGGSTSMNYNSGYSTANSGGGQYSSLMKITKKTTVKLSCSNSHFSTFQVTLYSDGTAQVEGVYNVGKLVGKSFSTSDAYYRYESGSYHDTYKRWIEIVWRDRDREAYYYETLSITEDGLVKWSEMYDFDIPKLSDCTFFPGRVISVY